MTDLRLRTTGLKWRLVEDEVIAVDLLQSTYLSANGSGAILWQALAEGTTRTRLVDLLVREFAIESERAARDVEAFLADLEIRKLLDEASA